MSNRRYTVTTPTATQGDITTAQSVAPLTVGHAGFGPQPVLGTIRSAHKDPLPPTPAMYDTLMDAALALATRLVGFDYCPLKESGLGGFCGDQDGEGPGLRTWHECGDDGTPTCARRVVDAEIERVER